MYFFRTIVLILNTLLFPFGCRGTLGACFSTTLGAVLHELCHTFDLGHTEDGVMGRGFNNIQNVFLPSSLEITQTNSRTFVGLNSAVRKLKGDDIYWTRSCATLLNFHRLVTASL